MSAGVCDGRGKSVRLVTSPQRIISLVPSTTESLFDLGCGDRLVGVTKYCCHPADRVSGLPKVGGTKDASVDRILALQADLVIGNCEENTAALFDALEPTIPVYAAFPRSVHDAVADLGRLGTLLGVEESAAPWVARITDARAGLQSQIEALAPVRVAYLIWRKPWMAVSGDTFISSLLNEAGCINVFQDADERFPMISLDDLRNANPDVVLLSSEPLPFREHHRQELIRGGFRPEQVRFVDGELCSWHGTRLVQALPYLALCRRTGWPLRPRD